MLFFITWQVQNISLNWYDLPLCINKLQQLKTEMGHEILFYAPNIIGKYEGFSSSIHPGAVLIINLIPVRYSILFTIVFSFWEILNPTTCFRPKFLFLYFEQVTLG